MHHLFVPAGLFLLASSAGCLVDGYCNDGMAGTPACDGASGGAGPGGSGPGGSGPGGSGPGGSGPTSTAPQARISPISLGDGGASKLFAVGGAAELVIETRNLTDVSVSFRGMPFVAIPSGTWRVEHVIAGDTLEVHGTHASGPYDERFSLGSHSVDAVILGPGSAYTRQRDDDALTVLAESNATPAVAIQLWAGEDRLVDQSMHLEPAGTSTAVAQVAWDRLQPPVAPGVHRVRLAADSFGIRDFELTVVDHLDRLASSARGTTRCFHAMVGEQEVYATWEIVVDQIPVATNGRNCVKAPSGATVVARAGGLEVIDTL